MQSEMILIMLKSTIVSWMQFLTHLDRDKVFSLENRGLCGGMKICMLIEKSDSKCSA